MDPEASGAIDALHRTQRMVRTPFASLNRRTKPVSAFAAR